MKYSKKKNVCFLPKRINDSATVGEIRLSYRRTDGVPAILLTAEYSFYNWKNQIKILKNVTDVKESRWNYSV